MSESGLAVEIRSDRGKGAARRLRAAGKIPGVVYGPKHDAVSITFDPSALERIIKTSHAGLNTLIDLQGTPEIAGRTVLVKELQREPVYGTLVHADLYELDLTKRVRVSVPIHLKGTALGVTLGGLIDHALRSLEVECLAGSIPDEIVVDVSALDVGDSIHVSDLVLPADVEVHSGAELPVVSVVAPAAEEVAAPQAVEGAEPALVSDAADKKGDDSTDS